MRKDSLNVTLFSEKKITGTADVSENKMMYFSFPYDKGWHLFVDGKETEKVYMNCGMTGVYLPKGKHEVVFEFHLRTLQTGTYMSLGGVLFCGLLFVMFRRQNTKKDTTI